MKAKVKLLIEAAFHMEDVIDQYLICEEQEPRDPRCAGLPCEPSDFIKTMILRLQIAYKIQDVKSRVRAINESSERKSEFHIQPFLEQGPSSSRGNQNSTLEKIREAPLYMDEAQIVGFEAPRDELVGWLIKGRTERTVITVVGMGGLGKTTLAKKVFDNREVIGHFDCHAWITVSQSYTEEGLLRDMLLKFYEDKMENPPHYISTMDRKSLMDEVRNCLQQKRYLVFFDDVWDEHFWDQIELVAHDNKNGSRILITTRSISVAVSCKKSSFVKIHDLKPLTKEKSWELFCKKAFQFEFDGCCPKELEHISYGIVEKCNGLPLALVVIGGLLSSKNKSIFEWEEFSENLSLELQKNQDLASITKILGFSYNDLPYHLKSCILYFGIYPEDYEIKSKRLIRQWIAEGFIKQEERKTLEKVAEGYLKDLIDRSLVQVSSLTLDGKASCCRVHDLTRELILRKCEDLRFCHIVHDQSVLNGVTRRLSIATRSNDLMSNNESSHIHIRSLFAFLPRLPQQFVNTIPIKYLLSKVLDFEKVGMDYVPNNLGNLIHLKYLSFRNARVRNLPISIGKLKNLETLDLRGTYVREVPKKYSKLRKLQHLLGDYMTLTEWKDDIGGMTSLQSLGRVRIVEDEIELIRALGRLTQMRKLILAGFREEHGSALCTSLNELKFLENLHVASNTVDLQFNSSLPMFQKLTLWSKFEKPRQWIPKLQKLVKLSLGDPNLTDDPTKLLKDLPNLLHLQLIYYGGLSLHFQNGGFQKLKKLALSNLDNLNSICIEEGALCSLKSFWLCSIPKLDEVPSGIQYLKDLEFIDVERMSTKFEQNIGVEHPAIQHVALVKIKNYEGTRIFHHSRTQKS